MTDELLMQKVAAGDEEALVALVKKYEQRLLRYVHGLGRISNEDAEEIVQESFIDIYKNSKGFDVSLSFSAWAYRITRNNTYSWMRKMKARPHIVIPVEEIAESLTTSQEDVHKKAEQKSNRKHLEKIVEKLNNKYKEVVILKYFEDMDYQQISDVLKIPVSTVATRLQRAKEQLKESLEKDE